MSLSPKQQRLMTWLMTQRSEREPKTQAALAAELDVTPDTLTAWKRDDEFLKEWNAQYLRTISNPGRKMEIMETLLRTATDQEDPKHVQAAKTFFEIEGSLRPSSHVEVEVKKPLSELTDEQLAALAAKTVGDELAARREAS